VFTFLKRDLVNWTQNVPLEVIAVRRILINHSHRHSSAFPQKEKPDRSEIEARDDSLMKVVTRLEFVPRPALPCISGSDQFMTTGSFFLITGRSFFLTDFVSGDRSIHVSREFEVVIDRTLSDLISRFQTQFLLPESLNALKQLKLQILPVMTSGESDEWKSTLCWL
jgi:hypothetical protein